MKDIPYEMWIPVIGLEVHVQLNTKSKLFSAAPNRFGDEPNSNITDLCTGQPGTLPVLNEEAVFKAVLFGLAINADIASFSKFDRKSYFYPDLPRNFQITQFEHPIILNGKIIADVEGKTKQFAVDRAHLEDDAGMLKHFSTFTGVDYNRAGVPLLEIVSKPCMQSSKEAVAYVMAIKAIMQYLDASDCNMEEGSLRIDANISVRPKDDNRLRNKTEIKNMNSFSFLEMAIDSEIRRQIRLYMENPHEDFTEVLKMGTYRWDPQQRKTVLMRTKETEEDYRYFPEPDLVPIILTKKYIEKVRKHLPELPHERFKRYISQYQLSEYSASILINDKKLADFFEDAGKTCSNAKALCNWITIEFAGRLKEKGTTLFSLGIKSENIAHLVNMIDEQIITGKIAKKVADNMVQFPHKNPRDIVKENSDYQPVLDVSTIEPVVDQVISENPQSIADYKAGKTKAFAHLVGQVMKLTRGKSSPHIATQLLKKKIERIK